MLGYRIFQHGALKRSDFYPTNINDQTIEVIVIELCLLNDWMNELN